MFLIPNLKFFPSCPQDYVGEPDDFQKKITYFGHQNMQSYPSTRSSTEVCCQTPDRNRWGVTFPADSLKKYQPQLITSHYKKQWNVWCGCINSLQ